MPTANSMITPSVICSYSGSGPGRSKPLPTSAMNRTPTNVRQTAPSPPRMLVPPTTIPASTVKASASPAPDCALSARDASSTPARPAAAPLIENAGTRIAFTRTPASRAASALPPAAYM